MALSQLNMALRPDTMPLQLDTMRSRLKNHYLTVDEAIAGLGEKSVKGDRSAISLLQRGDRLSQKIGWALPTLHDYRHSLVDNFAHACFDAAFELSDEF